MERQTFSGLVVYAMYAFRKSKGKEPVRIFFNPTWLSKLMHELTIGDVTPALGERCGANMYFCGLKTFEDPNIKDFVLE